MIPYRQPLNHSSHSQPLNHSSRKFSPVHISNNDTNDLDKRSIATMNFESEIWKQFLKDSIITGFHKTKKYHSKFIEFVRDKITGWSNVDITWDDIIWMLIAVILPRWALLKLKQKRDIIIMTNIVNSNAFFSALGLNSASCISFTDFTPVWCYISAYSILV